MVDGVSAIGKSPDSPCRHCANWDRDDTEPKKLCVENGVRTWPGNTCEAFAN